MISKPVMSLATVLVALAMLVAGCGSDEDEGGPSGAQATATEAATQDADAGEKGEDGDSEEKREKEEEEAKGAASKSCAEVDLDGTPKEQVPADLPLPGDAKVYESEGPFGKTVRYFAVTDGESDQLPAKRDDASDILVENGYKLLSKDEEAGAEAEAHLSGKHTVDIQVINLCEGKLRIRYTVS
jgi:hypothetical protein